MSDGDYDFTGMKTRHLTRTRVEQIALLTKLHHELQAANHPDRVATLEAEVLSGFELLAALDAEIEVRKK